MSYTVTTLLGLQKAVPGTNQAFEIPVWNSNMDKTDAAVVADRARLATLEGGVGRSGASGGAVFVSTTLAQLNAISVGSIGDLGCVTDPGNGNAGTGTIDYLEWVAISGAGASLKWRPAGTIVATSKANMDTFIAAVAATTDLRFEVGASWVDASTAIQYQFTSTVGAYTALSLPVWQTYTPTIANLTLGASTVAARYLTLAGYCQVEIDVTMGAGSAMGTAPTFSTPVPFGSGYLADAPLGHESTALVAGTTYFVAVLRSASSTNLVTFYQKNVAGTYESLTSTSAAVPAAWGTTGVMQLRFGFRV